MIALLDASCRVGTGAGARIILMPTSHVFAAGEKVGVLAPRGAGKTTLARMLCGIRAPDTGHVLRQGRVSWPVGFAGFLHPDLALQENLRLTARLLGQDPLSFIATCIALGGLEDMLDRPLKQLSPVQRAAAGFCCSLGVDCDTYVADDTTGFGLGPVRERSEAALLRRIEGRGLILLSSNPRTIGQFCDRVLVLLDGRLVPCRDSETAAEALASAGPRPGAALAGEVT